VTGFAEKGQAMNVKQRMTPSPITANRKTTHQQAMKLMREHHIRRLPVVDRNGHLIGIVTMSDLLSAAPSQATSLSIYEIYTLLSELTLDQIMTSPVYAVNEDCPLAQAARLMLDHHIGALPVMRGDELVGIITETDIFRMFVEVLGGGEPGFRIDLRVPDEKGTLAAVSQVFAEAGSNIVSVTTFRGEDAAHGILSIKERGADEEALRAAVGKLDNVEIVEFRPSGQTCLRELGPRS
jgi:acetoin utilization protein AcuB